jgi:hypothetical protein
VLYRLPHAPPLTPITQPKDRLTTHARTTAWWMLPPPPHLLVHFFRTLHFVNIDVGTPGDVFNHKIRGEGRRVKLQHIHKKPNT